jgi:hypothetical protein
MMLELYLIGKKRERERSGTGAFGSEECSSVNRFQE